MAYYIEKQPLLLNPKLGAEDFDDRRFPYTWGAGNIWRIGIMKNGVFRAPSSYLPGDYITLSRSRGDSSMQASVSSSTKNNILTNLLKAYYFIDSVVALIPVVYSRVVKPELVIEEGLINAFYSLSYSFQGAYRETAANIRVKNQATPASLYNTEQEENSNVAEDNLTREESSKRQQVAKEHTKEVSGKKAVIVSEKHSEVEMLITDELRALLRNTEKLFGLEIMQSDSDNEPEVKETKAENKTSRYLEDAIYVVETAGKLLRAGVVSLKEVKKVIEDVEAALEAGFSEGGQEDFSEKYVSESASQEKEEGLDLEKDEDRKPVIDAQGDFSGREEEFTRNVSIAAEVFAEEAIEMVEDNNQTEEESARVQTDQVEVFEILNRVSNRIDRLSKKHSQGSLDDFSGREEGFFRKVSIARGSFSNLLKTAEAFEARARQEAEDNDQTVDEPFYSQSNTEEDSVEEKVDEHRGSSDVIVSLTTGTKSLFGNLPKHLILGGEFVQSQVKSPRKSARPPSLKRIEEQEGEDNDDEEDVIQVPVDNEKALEECINSFLERAKHYSEDNEYAGQEVVEEIVGDTSSCIIPPYLHDYDEVATAGEVDTDNH